jgi:hypothetical protein
LGRRVVICMSLRVERTLDIAIGFVVVRPNTFSCC